MAAARASIACVLRLAAAASHLLRTVTAAPPRIAAAPQCARLASAAKYPGLAVTSERARLVTCSCALALLVWSMAACSNHGADVSDSKVLGLCSDTYGGICGQSCSSTSPCPLGLRCMNNQCSADCTPMAGCSEGQVCTLAGLCGPATASSLGTPCSPDGECPPSFGCDERICRATCNETQTCPSNLACTDGLCKAPSATRDSGAAIRASLDDADPCIDVQVSFEQQTPTIMLLVDQSATMNEQFGTGSADTRWTVLRDSLISSGTGLVPTLQSVVQFGLTMYTARKEGARCPLLSTVPPSLNNYGSISQAYANSHPIEDTPTGPAIRAMVSALSTDGGSGPRYILLVTDGLPDTCGDPDPSDQNAQDAANRDAVSAAQAAYAAGIGVFVLGVSADIAPEHLQQMANAGAGLPPNTAPPAAAPYWIADSASELASQLGAIIGTARSCVFMLHGMVQAGYESLGRVLLDGDELPYGDPNGWKLDSASQLELLGTSCNKVKMSGRQLSIEFPCDVFIPIH